MLLHAGVLRCCEQSLSWILNVIYTPITCEILIHSIQSLVRYYAPAPVGEAGALGGHRRLSVRPSVCLSDVAYIGSNSKTKRPRKTKLCTGVPQVTCDSHTDFKVKSQGGAGAYCGGDLAAQLVHDVLPSTVQFAFIYDILHRSCTWWYITQFVVNCLLLNGNLCGTLWIWNDCSLLISRLWISIVHIFFCYWCVS